MRLLAAICIAGCGSSPKPPQLAFSGEPTARLTPSADTGLTALVGGEIRVEGTWSSNAATSVLAVTCQPACTTEAHGPTTVIVHPPGQGPLIVTATIARDGGHDKLIESRVYQVVIPDDIDLICRDARGAIQACDLPQDARTGTGEVIAHVHGKIVERLAGMRIDGKEVDGTFLLADVVDVRTGGQHVVEITGGGLQKKAVISIAAP